MEPGLQVAEAAPEPDSEGFFCLLGWQGEHPAWVPVPAVGVREPLAFCRRILGGDAGGFALPSPEGVANRPLPPDPSGESGPGKAGLALGSGNAVRSSTRIFEPQFPTL